MIKAIVETRQGRNALFLILSEGNIERLKQNLPIHFHAEQMEMYEIKVKEVMIAYFETEEKAYKYLKSQGLVGADTVIVEDKSKPF